MSEFLTIYENKKNLLESYMDNDLYNNGELSYSLVIDAMRYSVSVPVPRPQYRMTVAGRSGTLPRCCVYICRL